MVNLKKDAVVWCGSGIGGLIYWELRCGNTYHCWPIFSKFFDNKGALPHHMHQMQEHASRVGLQAKPEAY